MLPAVLPAVLPVPDVAVGKRELDQDGSLRMIFRRDSYLPASSSRGMIEKGVQAFEADVGVDHQLDGLRVVFQPCLNDGVAHGLGIHETIGGVDFNDDGGRDKGGGGVFAADEREA